jgi:hypothetical protein
MTCRLWDSTLDSWFILLTMAHERDEGERIADALEDIASLLRQIVFGLHAAKGFSIYQTTEGIMGAITGIVKGSIGQFTGVPDPAGSQLQAGSVPKWSSDDPNTSMTASADGSAVAVQTSATDTATSFNLTQSGVASDGTPISTTVSVPLTGGTPPVTPAKGFNITQVS